MPLKENTDISRCRRATDIYLLVMLSAFPVFTGFSGYLYLHLKKYVFFAVATLLWGVYLLQETVRRAMRGEQFSRPRLPELLMLLFMTAATISTVCSQYAGFLTLGERYDGLLTHLLYGCAFLGVFRYGQMDRRKQNGFAAAYAICCLIALMQLLGRNALWLFPDKMNYYDPIVQETARFLGTVGNIDILSAYHCLAIPLLCSAVYREKSSRRRALLFGTILLGLVCQICAGVSSGLLAVTLTAAIFLAPACAEIYYARKGRNAPGLTRYSGLIFIFAMTALVYFWPHASGTIYELQRVLHGELREEFGSHRLLIWRETFAVIREHPLLGVGPDSLQYYLDITFERYSPLLGETLYSTVDNAHNEYLQALASFGVSGALPLLALLFYTAERFRRGSVRNPFAACMVCYLIQAFFNVGLSIVTPMFFVIWALALRSADS